jgi:hypothetical protein
VPGLLLGGITPKMSQAVAQLVKVLKAERLIEAAARPCAAARLRGDRQPGASEPARYQSDHRWMRAQRVGYSVGIAVA